MALLNPYLYDIYYIHTSVLFMVMYVRKYEKNNLHEMIIILKDSNYVYQGAKLKSSAF